MSAYYSFMTDIIYPTVDLFLYDLRDALGQNPKEIEQNRQHFQKKLPAEVASLKLDTAFEAEYVELLPGKPPISRFGGNASDEWEGYYYPVRLSDTYGLLLDCSVNNQTEPQPAKSIKDIKAEIERRLNKEVATIGQSWVISGQLAKPDRQNPLDIAKICYRSLLPDFEWDEDWQGEGHFLGGATIFELWHYDVLAPEAAEPEEKPREESDTTGKRKVKQCPNYHHVMIILYPNSEIGDRVAEFNFDWMRLLCYRAKILWAYQQSRQLKQRLKSDYIAIQECIQDLQGNESKTISLKKLRQTLAKTQRIVSNYAITFSDLEYQAQTVEINLYNYRTRLGDIQRKAEKFRSAPDASDLKFLQRFAEETGGKYLLQLQKDQETFTAGLNLLDILINSIRAIVEVDEARRNANFQNVAAIVAAGLGAGSVAASISGQFPTAGTDATDSPETLKQHPIGYFLSYNLRVPDSWLVPATSGAYSFIVAAIASILTLLLIRVFWSLSGLWRRLGTGR